MSAPLRAAGLVKRYGAKTVLDGIDLDVDAGEVVALRGPNGAGKSTLIGCICGTVIPDEGRVAIGGHDLRAAPLAARAALRYLPQEPEVPAGLTGREVLRLFADVFGAAGDVAKAEAFTGLGESLDHLATTYSVGMRRTLMFGALIPGAPALWVLDEPFAGIDAAGLDRMLAALQAARGRGAGIIIAAHDADAPHLQALQARTVGVGT